MAENSEISWTTHTFNPWRGCTKVSAECDHCYAETMSGRNPSVLGTWGKYGSRIIASESYWKEPLKWDKKAEAAGERHRVFCASLADVFEGSQTMPEASVESVHAARFRLFSVIANTPNLDWLLLTKRPELMAAWMRTNGYHAFNDYRLATEQWPADNIWCGTSVGVKKTKHRIDDLRTVNARVRFLSIEPLLEDLGELDLAGIHWVIIGGESGHGARVCDIGWIRSIVEQCKTAGVSVFVKQLGARPVGSVLNEQPSFPISNGGIQLDYDGRGIGTYSATLTDRKGGDIEEFPRDLRIREFPEVRV